MEYYRCCGHVKQRCIVTAVIERRKANLNSFCRGLNFAGFADLIEKWPNLMRPLLVSEDYIDDFKGLTK